MRQCSRCAKRYFRRSKLIAWTKQNPGKRDGWERVEVNLCIECMDAKSAKRQLTLAHVRIVPGLKKEKEIVKKTKTA